jgi:hypothetical protein
MKRLSLVALTVLLVSSFAAEAAAKKQKNKKKNEEPPPEQVEETEQVCPELVQENTLEGCKDGLDNDADGHVDCDDQDCEIYAMCVAPPAAKAAPPRPVPTFTNMRQLKEARYTRQITAEEYHRAWAALRQARSTELRQLRDAYEAGRLTRYEYRDATRAVRLKYEG